MLIRHADYLVLAKTDLEVHYEKKLLGTTDDYFLRPSKSLKQIDGAQRQLNSCNVREGITFHYWSYC